MSSTFMAVPAARAAAPFGRLHARDLNSAAVAAGISAFIFYITAGVPLLIAVTGQLGLTTAQTSRWFFIVFFSTAATSIVLSLSFRQPLPLNWSVPGLLFLGSLAGRFTIAELVGANIMAGVVMLLIGLLGLGPRLVALLPLPIAMGMFAGSILGTVSGLVTATVDDVIVAGASLGGYLVGRGIRRRGVPPVGLAAVTGGLAVVLTRPLTTASIHWTLPVVMVPEAAFSWSAFIGITLPLVAFSVILGNVQALGYLRGQGYRVPINVLTLVVGAQSLVNALFGGHQAILGRNGVALLSGPAAGPVAGRYWASLVANSLLLPVAFAAAPLAGLLPIVPGPYLATLAGLAILPSFQEAIVAGFGSRLRFGATVAFLIAATPITVAGVPAAFWALLAGVAASRLTERSELREVKPIE
jgi:benzoate membrane transport protein